MVRTCIECSRQYFAEEDWKIRCLPCYKRFTHNTLSGPHTWRASRQPDPTKELHEKIGELEEALEHFISTNNKLQGRLADMEIQYLLAKAKLEHMPKASHPLSAEFLTKLIQLCHPDKHGDSPLSHSVTVELVKLKEVK